MAVALTWLLHDLFVTVVTVFHLVLFFIFYSAPSDGLGEPVWRLRSVHLQRNNVQQVSCLVSCHYAALSLTHLKIHAYHFELHRWPLLDLVTISSWMRTLRELAPSNNDNPMDVRDSVGRSHVGTLHTSSLQLAPWVRARYGPTPEYHYPNRRFGTFRALFAGECRHYASISPSLLPSEGFPVHPIFTIRVMM
jgi:hypothetical protein